MVTRSKTPTTSASQENTTDADADPGTDTAIVETATTQHEASTTAEIVDASAEHTTPKPLPRHVQFRFQETDSREVVDRFSLKVVPRLVPVSTTTARAKTTTSSNDELSSEYGDGGDGDGKKKSAKSTKKPEEVRKRDELTGSDGIEAEKTASRRSGEESVGSPGPSEASGSERVVLPQQPISQDLPIPPPQENHFIVGNRRVVIKSYPYERYPWSVDPQTLAYQRLVAAQQQQQQAAAFNAAQFQFQRQPPLPPFRSVPPAFQQFRQPPPQFAQQPPPAFQQVQAVPRPVHTPQYKAESRVKVDADLDLYDELDNSHKTTIPPPKQSKPAGQSFAARDSPDYEASVLTGDKVLTTTKGDENDTDLVTKDSTWKPELKLVTLSRTAVVTVTPSNEFAQKSEPTSKFNPTVIKRLGLIQG
ncbi:hypothetical protein AAVH_06153 [Aphelenchoides avenae]|nr:hypothetical protein AAVH_06153 [Aphelenchus avenae]